MQPTRPHDAEPKVMLITSTSAQAEDEVVLSYFEAPELKTTDVVSVEPVTVTDSEDCVLTVMFPNPAGVLCDENWNDAHEFAAVEVTDVFAGDEPMFYVYVCKERCASRDPNSVSISAADGRQLPSDHRVMIVMEPDGRYYRSFIYTNFRMDDEYTVSYYAVDDDGKTKRVTETLCPYPVGLMLHDQVAGIAGFTYRIAEASEIGLRRIIVDDGVVFDDRAPMLFRYRIKAEAVLPDGTVKTYMTTWKSDYVYNSRSLYPFEQEGYVGGRKVLTGEKCEIIIKSLFKDIPANALVRYSAESDNPKVAVSCRSDGQSPVYASTSVDTGAPNPLLVDSRKKWRVIPYTNENLAMLGLRAPRRVTALRLTVEKDGSTIYETVIKAAEGYGFGKTVKTISPVDLAGMPEDATVTVEPAEQTRYVNIRGTVGGQECITPAGTIASTVGEIIAHGGMVVEIEETFIPSCFVKSYAVKLTRRSLDVCISDKPAHMPWHISIRRGVNIEAADDGRYYAYTISGPNIVKTAETSPAAVDGFTVKLAKSPVCASVKTDGSIAGIRAVAGDRELAIDYVDVFTGIVKFRDPFPGEGAVIEYSYLPDSVDYSGFEEGDRFYRLDLNPARGHSCMFPGYAMEELPSSALIGKDVYICITPAAVVSYVKRSEQEELAFVGYERVSGRLAFRMRLKNDYLKERGIAVYRARDGMMLGGSEAYWTEVYGSTREILIVDPSAKIDPFGRLEERYLVDYYYMSKTPAIEQRLESKVYHSLRMPQDPAHLALAVVRIGFPYSHSDVKLLDARSRGGGVKESLMARAFEIEPESRHYWDIGYLDGEPFQRNGLVRVFLPNRLKERGWSEEFIKKQAERYKAAGTYFLYEYWDGDEVYPGRVRHVVLSLVETDDGDKLYPPQHLVLEKVLVKEVSSKCSA
jgi:hypothetical protein